MAKNNPINDLKKFLKKIEKTLDEAKKKPVMQSLAEEAVRLIVKRTRLGYGVTRNLGTRSNLKRLKASYIKQRKSFKSLSTSTRPGKSNLTLTGDMLSSVKVISIKDGKVSIGPTGNNRYGESNQNIAEWNADRGRTFNRLSLNEFNQLRRFYRKNFGDLLKKQKLLK